MARREENATAPENEEYSWILAHVFQLSRLMGDLLCPECQESGLCVTVCHKENMGFASKLKLKCSVCDYVKCEFSSPRLGDSDQKNVAFQINPKMVMFSHETGKSHTALQTCGSVVEMPAMHLSTFQDHDKKVTGMCFSFSLFARARVCVCVYYHCVCHCPLYISFLC